MASQPTWILYPIDSYPYDHGDLVYIKTKSRKEIGKRGRVSGAPEDGRIPIQIHEKHVTSQRQTRLIPIFHSLSGVIVVTEKTSSYRALAASQIEENDNVLEIGCSNGECSILLGGTILRGNGTLIGFDISPNMISEAKRKVQSELRGEHDRIQFYVMDPFSDPKGALTIMNKQRVNVVLIDIGGNRDFESVLSMIHWVQSVCSTRIIIIKSEGMISKILNDSQKRSNNDTKRAKFENAIHINSKGVLSRGQEWFDSQYSKIGSKTKGGPPTYIHPLKAPISLSPIDNETPICRYYNYHANGCKKGSNECKFDHIHCHWCKAKGHIALECSKSM